jgi:lipid II:glycine glycyltransferase (peptidoglycan interpeptide bridge formation enzyme)
MANQTNKKRYIQLCLDTAFLNNIPIFAQPFWLDAVAENWDVCLIIDNHFSVVAALPFCWKGNLLTKRIYLPDVSFYQSVIFFDEIENKNDVIQQLFQQLPKTVKSYFKFLPAYSNIDLLKLNYQTEIYFTYCIDRNQHELSFSNNHKRNIQKGIKQRYRICESADLSTSFNVLTATFKRQQITSKINFSNFENLHQLVKLNCCGKTLNCYDDNNNLLASTFIVEDAQTVYYLMGGYDASFKNSGAMTFLLNHVIQYTQQQKKDFNFCGSSKKTIATFFEGFGAERKLIAIWKKSVI